MEISIKVKAEYSADILTAKKWLAELEEKSLIACDFEAAIRYTPEQLKVLESIRDSEKYDFFERTSAGAVLKASPLDHPAHVKVTHFSVAWSDSDAYVFILDSQEITDLVMEFLVTTEVTQVWHRASYDFRLIYYATDKFPKNYEDSQVYAKTLFNHVDVFKARTGLKELAGAVYGSWAVAEEAFFTLDNMYNEKMLQYAATDACATFWIYQKMVDTFEDPDEVYPKTSEDYSPWEQLPAVNPKGAEYSESHFYHYTAKWLVRDTVRIMLNGLPIDLHRVRKLDEELQQILEGVVDRIDKNPTVTRFNEYRHESMKESYIKLQKSKLKTHLDFIAPFNSKNVVHRCFFMDSFADKVSLRKPAEKLPQGCSKWSVKLIRQFATKYPPLGRLVKHEISPDSPSAKEAMILMANTRAALYNEKYLQNIRTPDIPVPVFNPGSAQQKQQLFNWAGYSSDKVSSKTGLDSWDREQIEHLNASADDEDIKSLTSALIDHSFAAIVKSNFVQAFYRYTVDGVLYGQYNLLGAKSGRFTSSNP